MTARVRDHKWVHTPWGQGNEPAQHVVVVLFPSVSLAAVARTAVREAQAGSARLRFIQVHGLSGSAEEEDEFTFAAAVRALRDSPRLPVTFEAVDVHGHTTATPRGTEQRSETTEAAPASFHPEEALARLVVESSKDALVLVLGTASPEEQQLLAYAERHAACDVLAVKEAPAASNRRSTGRDGPEPQSNTQRSSVLSRESMS